MKKKYLLALFAFVLLTPILTAQNCSTLAITNTVDGSVCGEGSVTLEATASGTGDDIYWYDAATNGTYLGSGSIFQTPVINTTTSFWATEVIATGVTVTGAAKSGPDSAAINLTSSDYGVYFNATNSFTIVDVEVYPSAAGSISVDLRDSNGITLQTATVNVQASTGIGDPVVATLNLNVPTAGDYQLILDTTGFGMLRDFSGNTFPYPIGSVGSVTSGPSSFPGAYYYFYNWTVATGSVTCESAPREEVIATVNNAGDVVVNSLPYTDTDNTANFENNYSGAPGTDCGTTEDYLDGNDVIYEYTATADFIMNAELANIVDGETSLYVYESCADIGTSCLAGAVNPSVGDHSVDFSVVNGQTYYILISSTSTTNSFPYTFNLDGYLCANYPAPTTSVATPDFIDGQALLDLTVSGTNLTWYSDAALTNVIPDTTLMVDNTTYYVTQTFDTCESPALSITPSEVLCSVLSVSSSQGDSVCGEGSVTLEAQGAEAVVNTSVWWFDTATGGTVIGKGNVFETPIISQTTSFWATEVVTEGSLLTGQGETNPTGTLSTTTNGGIVLDVTQQMTLVDAEVFSTSSAGGLLEVELRDMNNGNATVASATMSMPSGGTSASPIAVTVPLNFNISPGQYRLVKVSGPTFKYQSGSFPDPLGTFGSVTGGATTTGTSSLNYIFYNLTVGNENAICESSPRTEVIATVNNVADIVTTNPLPYVDTDSTGNYANNYAGVPGTDCGATGNYLDGNDVVYEYTPDGDKVVKIGLSNLVGTDAAIFVYDNCNEIGDTCLAGAANIGSSSDFAIDEFTVYQSETYYIVISGNGDVSSIDYTLTIEEAIINCNDYTAGPDVDDPEFFNPGETLDDLDINGGNLIFYSDATGTTVLPGTTPAVDGTTYYVSQTLNGCVSSIVPVNVEEIVCSILDITSSSGDTVPCVGSATLTATASGNGTDIYWYENQTGGDPIAYGDTFPTDDITSTTSYWVSEVIADGTTTAGNARLAPDPGSSDFGGANYGVKFTALQQFTLVDLEIYPDGEAGTFDIELVNDNTNTVLNTVTVTVPNMDGATPFLVTLNFDIQPGDYRIVQQGTIDMTRDFSSTTTYPYPIGPNSSLGEVTSGCFGTTGSNSTSYYYYYNWTVTTGNLICESPREEVIATVNTNGDIQVTTVPYNNINDTANYGNPYEGSPGTNCNTTENYLNGNDVVYKFTAPNTELVDILMSDLSGFYASVFVYDNCGELLNSCLAGAVAGPSDDDFGIEDFQVTAGEDYYIVVSSWLNPTVGYTLDIIPFSCANLATPDGPSPQEFNTNDSLADLEVDATETGAILTWYSDANATNQIPDTTILVDGTTYYVTQTFNGCESDPLAITVNEIDCSNLVIVSSMGDSVSCQGSMDLTATGSGTGDEIYWYDSPTGGTPIAFGSPFTTPVLTNTTSYWAAEVQADGVTTVGNAKLAPDAGSTDFGGTGYGVKFTANQTFTIVDVEIYPDGEAGTFDIVLIDDNTDVALNSVSVTVPNMNGTTAMKVNLNFLVQPGDYRLVQDGVIDMTRDSGGNSFPYPIGTGGVAGEVTSGTFGTGSNSTSYYYFYNWTVNTGEFICESFPRTEVIATVNQTGDIQVDSTDLPYNTSDSTAVYGDSFDGDPGSDCPGVDYLGGNEVVYQYTADANNDDIIQIELTNVTNPNTGMYIYTSCGEVGTNCLEGATNEDSPSAVTIPDYYINAGETIFIVISSESNTVNYTLDIYGFDCNNVAGPIVDDTTPDFVQPNTIDDIDVEENTNSTGLTWYSDAGATMPIPTSTPLVDGTTYYVTQTILGCESVPIAVTPVEFDCTDLEVVDAESVIICSPGGEVNLTATTSNVGNAIIWYDAATGGNIVNTGSDFNPTVNQTTSYWVTEAFTDGTVPVSGFAKPAPTGTSDFGAANYGVKFTAAQSFTLAAVEVYPLGEAGTFDVELVDDNTNAVLNTVTVTVPNMNGTTPFVINLNFNITPGDYRLVQQGTIDLVRDFSGNNFPYPIGVNSSLGQVTSGTFGTTGSTSTTYYYFYNFTVGSADIICESPREEIIVTVNDQPTATPTGDAVQKFCEGATVADLLVNGADLQWYNSDTSNSPLAINEVLIDGGVYYASQTIDACESDNRLEVTVDVKDVADLPIASINQSFVSGETVEDIDVQGDNLIWYTSTDGLIFTVIDPSQVNLVDQGVYYVSQTPNGLCESDKLAITVHRVLGLDNPLFAGLNYYPNPMRNHVTVENSNIVERVELYSMLGQKVIDQKSNQRKVNLNVERLAAGPYFIKVTVDGKSAMIKVIKE